MTMTSEGSVSTNSSSRIRQFGLYRSIDARTEEFLRLSRKRQIKQGCACAAISTAITVTVVIIVFLVYMEYGMNTESNQQSLGKSAWIGLINDSLASTFEEKFSKSKMNFDRATIKLLPILIKALKKNRFLEKILEDYSSSSPAYEGKVTTEFSFKKDIFLNTKNWLNKPKSRSYTIEYKTSPIVFVKNPVRDVEYYAKIRKIRDYKRMMDYFEKMVNDKNGISPSNQMKNIEPEAQTESGKPIKKSNTTADRHSKLKLLTTLSKRPKLIESKPIGKDKITQTKQDVISNCNCPKHLNFILNKIFSTIQHLLSNDSKTKVEPCTNKRKNKSRSRVKSIQNSTQNRKTKTNISRIKINPTITPKMTQTPVQLSEFNNIFSNIETTVPSISIFQSLSDISKIGNTIPKTPSAKDQIQPTDASVGKILVTPPMKPIIDILSRKRNLKTTTENSKFVEESYKNIITEKVYIADDFEKPVTKSFSVSSQKTFPDLNPNEDNDDLITTTSTTNIVESLNKLNAHSIELLKLKPLSPSKRLNTTLRIETFLKVENTTSKFGTSNRSNLTEKGDSDNYSSTTIENHENFDLRDILNIKLDADMSSSLGSDDTTSSSHKNNIMQIYNKYDELKKDHKPLYVGYDNMVLEDEVEKLTHHDNDYHQDDFNKHIDTSYPKNDTAVNTGNANFWKKINSMISLNRPTYLEIHRNNWKHEDNDYDTNIKYNIFDQM